MIENDIAKFENPPMSRNNCCAYPNRCSTSLSDAPATPPGGLMAFCLPGNFRDALPGIDRRAGRPAAPANTPRPIPPAATSRPELDRIFPQWIAQETLTSPAAPASKTYRHGGHILTFHI